MNLHLFNPENDLALARDLANYTAPPAAVALARAGAALPLWYGAADDAFVCEGVDAGWLRNMTGTFGLRTRPWDHSAEGLAPSPWGWSKAARRRFMALGFAPESLPDDRTLDRLRILSSRRSSCVLGEELVRAGLLRPGCGAREIADMQDARDYCHEHPDALFKLPWSSSGRGQIRVCGLSDFAARSGAVEGALRRYGFITAEPFHRNKAADLALLFEADASGTVRPAGLSLFMTAPNGDYAGNVLASDETIIRSLDRRFGVSGPLARTGEALRSALETLLGGAYRGPMGVDMMVLESGELIGCVELNLRMTMGHVARRFHDRFCAPGSEGVFRIISSPSGTEPDGIPQISDGRLLRGSLRLNPPGPSPAFIASLTGR